MVLFEELLVCGEVVELFDGDVVCENLFKGLGFFREDCDINVCCIVFVVGLFVKYGVMVLVSVISFYVDICCEVFVSLLNVLEVFVDVLLEVVIECDVKGLYFKVFVGEILYFIGVFDFYEVFENFDLYLWIDCISVEDGV